MRFDSETYLPEDVLTKVDRMSMAHSIESRVPLLDNDVIAFAAALPAALKIKNGRRKHVLKEVAAALVPRAILDRRKQGFGVPLGTWFRGNLRELFADTLLSPSSLQRGYFQPAFIRRIVDEHLAGTRDHTLQLWQLVVFEKWQQQYVNSFPLSAPAFHTRRAASPSEELRNAFPEFSWHPPCSVHPGATGYSCRGRDDEFREGRHRAPDDRARQEARPGPLGSASRLF